MKRFLKRLGYTALIALPVLSATPSFAGDAYNNGWYASLTGDATWRDTYNRTGGGGYLSVGQTLWPSDFGSTRLEGEVGYHDIKGNDYYSYMGNIYYDVNGMKFGSLKIGPYVGAGLGDADAHFNAVDGFGRYTLRGNVLAYQLMAGLDFVSDTLPAATWFLGYRYLGSSDVDGHDNVGVSSQIDLDNSNVELGLRYNF